MDFGELFLAIIFEILKSPIRSSYVNVGEANKQNRILYIERNFKPATSRHQFVYFLTTTHGYPKSKTYNAFILKIVLTKTEKGQMFCYRRLNSP